MYVTKRFDCMSSCIVLVFSIVTEKGGSILGAT